MPHFWLGKTDPQVGRRPPQAKRKKTAEARCPKGFPRRREYGDLFQTGRYGRLATNKLGSNPAPPSSKHYFLTILPIESAQVKKQR